MKAVAGIVLSAAIAIGVGLGVNALQGGSGIDTTGQAEWGDFQLDQETGAMSFEVTTEAPMVIPGKTVEADGDEFYGINILLYDAAGSELMEDSIGGVLPDLPDWDWGLGQGEVLASHYEFDNGQLTVRADIDVGLAGLEDLEVCLWSGRDVDAKPLGCKSPNGSWFKLW